ncbi:MULTISPECIES: ClbS/DfsB family four-helix bundle protein [unclassified Sphingobacterium]|uniref:ClbS/DfsB family four-helix bundle protein n=1 Tax=unclassified Sphingobacterium TaxID=2609468 RepID=UPI0029529C4E|nr:ClbS/DfsB family four-helix bundle protein [Sphingobacterium sp. UGAL515B_05]
MFVSIFQFIISSAAHFKQYFFCKKHHLNAYNNIRYKQNKTQHDHNKTINFIKKHQLNHIFYTFRGSVFSIPVIYSKKAIRLKQRELSNIVCCELVNAFCATAPSRANQFYIIICILCMIHIYAMAIPTTKDELLQAIRTNYSKLVCELSDIPVDQTNLLILQGHAKGTVMSINNLISYLIGWGELVLKWNKKSEDDKEVDFPETGFKWNELGKLAQKFYQDYAHLDFTTLCAKLDQTVLTIMELLEQKNKHAVVWCNLVWKMDLRQNDSI